MFWFSEREGTLHINVNIHLSNEFSTIEGREDEFKKWVSRLLVSAMPLAAQFNDFVCFLKRSDVEYRREGERGQR